ncbi:radical SAM protein [Pseudothermotoga sp. U03pept]|uniref:radical SAM protein n=1 Tax=Pseudothermotoga sp. U03pept TaxID=3447012 RepID=UPI003F03B459
MILRASVGTLCKLGMHAGSKLELSTAYLMLDGRCQFNCLYCTHALSSQSDQRFLSRVTWKEIDPDRLIESLKNSDFKRICVQTVSYKGYRKDLCDLMVLLSKINKPISVSVRPTDFEEVKGCFDLGADRVGIAIDVPTERLFTRIRGGNFRKFIELIENSSRVFEGRISTHIIVGLGETDFEIVSTMKKMYDLNVQVGLFAFTPIRGTALYGIQKPSLQRYRKIQLARYFIFSGRSDLIVLDGDWIVGFKEIPHDALKAFLTSGCPDCSRPYYSEQPGQPLYNIHSAELLSNVDLMREVK